VHKISLISLHWFEREFTSCFWWSFKWNFCAPQWRINASKLGVVVETQVICHYHVAAHGMNHVLAMRLTQHSQEFFNFFFSISFLVGRWVETSEDENKQNIPGIQFNSSPTWGSWIVAPIYFKSFVLVVPIVKERNHCITPLSINQTISYMFVYYCRGNSISY
jgi:hypothetical protein